MRPPGTVSRGLSPSATRGLCPRSEQGHRCDPARLRLLPQSRHVWFCWRLRPPAGVTPDESIICVTDHTSKRALGTSVGMMMTCGRAPVDDPNAVALLELVQQGMCAPNPPRTTVWGRPRRPICLVIDRELDACFAALKHALAQCGVTVLCQGRSALGEAHSARALLACQASCQVVGMVS